MISDCWQILLVLDMRSLVPRPWDSGQAVTQWNVIMDMLYIYVMLECNYGILHNDACEISTDKFLHCLTLSVLTVSQLLYCCGYGCTHIPTLDVIRHLTHGVCI